ncbi:MAG TPA: hypothetical protein PK720_01585 [bacterium]|nr:hypothetical protein [bacterium]
MKETLDFFNQPEPSDNISNLIDQEPEDVEAIPGDEKNNIQKKLETVKDFSRLYLENIYQNGVDINDRRKQMLSDDDLSHQIARLIGDEEEIKNNSMPAEYRQSMAVFIQELIKFSSEKLGIQDQKEKAYNFISSIKDLLFSASPSIANEIDLDELLLATAKANRIPEIQGWFGQTMVDEAIYEINLCSEEIINSLIQKIKNLSVPDTLDIIQQLETIGAKAAGGGWADRAVTKTEKIIQGIKDQHYSPLMAYAVDSALERVKEEEINPTMGIVTFLGDRSYGRISETLEQQLKEQSIWLQTYIRPSINVPPAGNMIRIASDSIAITDHTNTPCSFASFDVNNLPKENNQPSILPMEQAKQLVTTQEMKDPASFEEFVNQVNSVIFTKTNNNLGSIEQQAKLWQEASQVLTVSEWENYLTAAKHRKEFIQNYEKESDSIYENYQEKNDALGKSLIEKCGSSLPLITAHLPKEIKPQMEKVLVSFTESINQNDNRKALDIIGTFYQVAQEANSKTPDTQLPELSIFINNYELAVLEQEENKQITKRADVAAKEKISQRSEYKEAIRDYLLIHQKIAKQHKTFSTNFNHYLESIVTTYNNATQKVNFTSYDNLLENNELNPFAKTTQEQTPLLLRHLHDPKMRQAIEGDLNINLLSLPLRSQIHLLRFLSNTNQKTFNRFKTIITTNPSFKENFLRSFLVVSEDQAYGEHLLTLAETIPNQESGEKLFAAYTSFSDQVHSVAKTINKDLQEMYQDVEITEETIVQGLLIRGKDYLVELKDALQKNPHQAEQLINSFISELQAENPKTQIIRSQFKNIASLLSKENIELDKYEKSQALILESLLDKDNKAMSFRVLQRMNRLQPIPEIHWKVDRSIEDYNRRLGIQLPLFLKERSNSKNSKQTLLEIGPGNGLNKEERDKQGITKYYNDFALSDKIYYPLDSVISKVLNFETIEKEIGQTLSLEEKNQLSGIIYKSLIISEGRAHEDTLSYDTAIQNKLDQDINSLKEILPTLGSKIKKATLLPSEISSRSQSGEVIYPHKIDVTTLSSTIQLAKKILEKNITHYLNNDWETADYNTYISGFPANTMIGDIKDINRLADNQIDVELAVRSTVYSRHEDYENFLTTLVDKLKTGGVALDDSIRDNDGWYYRFAEIIKAREQFKNETEILVILGPGFPGEDYQQERVPLSLIITKEGSSKELLASQLEPNCEVISFDELTNDEKYLTSLDSTGLTYTRAQAAKKTTSTLAA